MNLQEYKENGRKLYADFAKIVVGILELAIKENKYYSYHLQVIQHRAKDTKSLNTGCREQEVCRLQWDWELEIELSNLKTSVFLIPKELVKNGQERLVVLNDIAKSVIEEVRGMHPTYVFTYGGHSVTSINNSAWKRAGKQVGLQQVRVHVLKHTFGSRLRAADVSTEDRQDLLGENNQSSCCKPCPA